MSEIEYTTADFKSTQDVKWCPGCGDYSILAAVQRTLPKLAIKKEDIVFVSGIGCSSRFPYYMNTYGFHTIHGRAPAIATGVKLANPDLSVWIITGDGDALSIGGNHFIHLLRRNLNVNLLLFNNEIYGLTKGQVSPTSRSGTKTKTSILGSFDNAINPTNLATAAGATFVARTIDRDPKHMAEVFEKAAQHNGTSFVEIYQNCVIFNDGVFEALSDKHTKTDHLIVLEDNKALIFSNGTKGISISSDNKPIVLEVNEENMESLYIHRDDNDNEFQSYLYGAMTEDPNLPTPIGIFLKKNEISYEQKLHKNKENIQKLNKKLSIEEIINSGDTWEIS